MKFQLGQQVNITAGNGRDGTCLGIVARVWDMTNRPGEQLYTVVVSAKRTYVRLESSVFAIGR